MSYKVIPGDRCTRKVGFCQPGFGKGQIPKSLKVWNGVKTISLHAISVGLVGVETLVV